LIIYLTVEVLKAFDQLLLVGGISQLAVCNFRRNFLLNRRKLLVDAFLQDNKALFSRLYFCLQILPELVLSLPELLVDALQAVLTARQQ